jgi:hypothetical protein
MTTAKRHKAHVITALPGWADRGHLGGVSPAAVNLAGGGPGYDREALPPMTSRNLSYDGNGLACVNHADLIIGCDLDATVAAYQQHYALIFIDTER